jgi:hypothetical protein
MSKKKEKIDIKVATHEEALWTRVVEHTKERIKHTEEQLKVERVLLKAAEDELKKANK